MLKRRIIAVLLIKSGWVVQSFGFKHYFPIGKPKIAMEFLNHWGIDEIIIHDIDAAVKEEFSISSLNHITKRCFVPVTYGGGLKTTEDMIRAIREGADKVSINTAAYTNPSLIEQGANLLGNQCIVASIDFQKDSSNTCIAYSHSGRRRQEIGIVGWAKEMESRGAGEILINSVDRDGKKCGYDLEVLESVVNAVNIPVICCGGVGTVHDFIEGFEHGATACAAANFFHFIEHQVNLTKAFLIRNEVEVRLETHANYRENPIGKDGRLLKKSDRDLEELRFEQIKEEVI